MALPFLYFSFFCRHHLFPWHRVLTVEPDKTITFAVAFGTTPLRRAHRQSFTARYERGRRAYTKHGERNMGKGTF